MLESTNCSALEEVAAFAEGRLRGAQRDRLIAHLAGCADCREVLAETIETAEELDAEEHPGVVATMAAARHRPRPSRWMVRSGALAATVVAVAAVVAWQLHVTRTPPSPSEWLAQMRPAAELAPHVWGGVKLRGGGVIGALQQQSTELGALLVDLEVTVQAGDTERANDVLRRMVSILDDFGYMEEDVTLLQAIARESDPARMTAALAAARPTLKRDFADRLDEQYLPLGSFLEEAHIAARAGNREFLASARIRRHLKWLLSQDLTAPAREALLVLASEASSDKDKAEAALDALQALTW